MLQVFLTVVKMIYGIGQCLIDSGIPAAGIRQSTVPMLTGREIQIFLFEINLSVSTRKFTINYSTINQFYKWPIFIGTFYKYSSELIE